MLPKISGVNTIPARRRPGTISLYLERTSSNPLQNLSSEWKLKTS